MPRLRADLIECQERDGYVTVAEASRRTGICERTLRSWTRGDTLKTKRVGPMLVFVEVESLRRATGATATPTGGTLPPAAGPPQSGPIRELTLHRDEESQ